MKKIGFILILFAILLSSCDLYYGEKIYQEIEEYKAFFAVDKDGFYLKTYAIYDDKLVYSMKDEIDIDKTEEVAKHKCKRYEEAKIVIDKIIAIKHSKCDN